MIIMAEQGDEMKLLSRNESIAHEPQFLDTFILDRYIIPKAPFST